MTAFVRHALMLCPRVLMLLRLQFLEGVCRTALIDESGFLRRVHVFKRRLPMMHRANWNGPRASSAQAFACRDDPGPTVIDRI
jgi:hypothetical protein